MTRDDIIRMAREAGFKAGHLMLTNGGTVPFVSPVSATECLSELERFAAIVAAAEREACAQACQDVADDCWIGSAQHEAAKRCMNAINARAKK